MTIKPKKAATIRHQMGRLLRMTFRDEIFENTGMMFHLRHVTFPTSGRGKVMHFQYKKLDFRMTSNLVVQEFMFGFGAPTSLTDTTMSREIQTRIHKQAKRMRMV